MRVLVLHNRYRSENPSGENRVVDDDVRLLRAAGVEVDVLQRDSDEITEGLVHRVVTAAGAVRSSSSVADLSHRLATFRPDVVHLHNPYPLLSPWVVRTSHGAGVPVVQTVHNYRHACVSGTLYRDGARCTACVRRMVPWPSVAHGCYRASRLQSAPMAVAQLVHRPTWRLVARFIAVSRFVADWLVESGVDRSRVVIRANAVPDEGRASRPYGSGFLFAGRLDEQKGVLRLLNAWEATLLGAAGQVLTIAGDGPLRATVEARAAALPGVRVTGRVSREEVNRLLDEHAVAVIPSLWDEPFGLLVIEAFARGRPVLVTGVGALPEPVDGHVGWVTTCEVSGIADALIRAAALGPARLTDMGRVARARYDERFAAVPATAALIRAYERVVAESRDPR